MPRGRTQGVHADVSSFELDDQLEALFLDGKLMTMARYPNFNPKMPYSGGWAYVPGRWRSMYKFIQGPDAPKRTEMPVGAKDLYVEYDGYGMDCDDCIAGFAFLQ